FGFFDADLATPLTEIRWLLQWGEREKKTGMIIGARVNLFGSTHISRYMLRHYFGRFFATIVSNMLGISIYDTQCGAKLFRADMATVLFGRPFLSRWLFDIELIYRLLNHFGREQVQQEL